MRVLFSGLATVLACFHLVQVAADSGASDAMDGMQNALDIQREQMARMSNLMDSAKKPPGGPAKGSTITFKNPAAKKFEVDGTKIPDGQSCLIFAYVHNMAQTCSLVDFDAGPSWSGLMPISGAKNETRKLFFW